jgi:hypothetical protein
MPSGVTLHILQAEIFRLWKQAVAEIRDKGGAAGGMDQGMDKEEVDSRSSGENGGAADGTGYYISVDDGQASCIMIGSSSASPPAASSPPHSAAFEIGTAVGAGMDCSSDRLGEEEEGGAGGEKSPCASNAPLQAESNDGITQALLKMEQRLSARIAAVSRLGFRVWDLKGRV